MSEEHSKEVTQPKKKEAKPVSARIGCLVVGIFLFLLLGLSAGATLVFEIPYRLLVGWLHFLTNNVAALEVNWEMAACGIGALVLATFGLHHCMIWLRDGKPWRLPWTISMTAMMLALFAASVAMTGIIHQLAWMTREPLTQSNRRSILTLNTSNSKQIFYLLVDYEMEHGSLPNSLEELVKEGYMSPEIMREFMFRPSRGRTPETWIYLGAGTNLEMEEESGMAPLLVSPHSHHGKWLVLRHDGAVKQLTTKMLKEKYPVLLERLPHLFGQE